MHRMVSSGVGAMPTTRSITEPPRAAGEQTVATGDEEETGLEQSSVIAAFIRRFREEPPTSPDHRAVPKNKGSFWWIDKDNQGTTGVALQHSEPADNMAPFPETSKLSKDTSTSHDISSESAAMLPSMATRSTHTDAAAITEHSTHSHHHVNYNVSHGTTDVDMYDGAMDISEGEVPRDNIPVSVSARERNALGNDDIGATASVATVAIVHQDMGCGRDRQPKEIRPESKGSPVHVEAVAVSVPASTPHTANAAPPILPQWRGKREDYDEHEHGRDKGKYIKADTGSSMDGCDSRHPPSPPPTNRPHQSHECSSSVDERDADIDKNRNVNNNNSMNRINRWSTSEPPVNKLESLLESKQQKDEFEFDFGMEDLDARTNQLLQKCDAVLENFKTKATTSSPSISTNPSTVTHAKDEKRSLQYPTDDAVGSYILSSGNTNRESFKAARDSTIGDERTGNNYNSSSSSGLVKMASPVRGIQGGNESIFSLTSVLSEEEEEQEYNTPSLSEQQTRSSQQVASMAAATGSSVVDTYDIEPNIQISEEKKPLEADRGQQPIKATYTAGGEGGGISPTQSSARTPPRKKAAPSVTSKRGRRHGHKHQLTSPESVRSINGISIDNSGLFMFLSSSDEGEEGGEDENSDQSSDDEIVEVDRKMPPSGLKAGSDLSRSSASCSEDYHRLMNSLEGVELLGGPREGTDQQHARHSHPYSIMRASKESLRESRTGVGGAAPFTHFHLNAESLRAYLDDEIVSVLWKQLLSVRSELRRRTEEQKGDEDG